MGQKTEKIYKRAKENLDKQNHEHALRLLNEVLNREPSHPQALRNKALLKVLNENDKEAEQFLLFAIEQQPNDDQLHQLLGTLYHNNGKPHKALAQFNKSIAANPDNEIAQQGAAMVYAHMLGEHEQAITHFTKALESDPKNAELLFNRGCSYMIAEKMDEAEQDLRKAADLKHEKANEMLKKYF
ncbi:MAG: tetratricopeptide repeat protein [Candidatus Dadabacteria bacterium]|nr:tetratricopeptide repeat protein [Candidatus Dadabacteria bacterium]NIU00982.1 tetratricopeptide repeat protein [Nitrosopumilaceae archaeon]NIV15087.1 tetratricopeptide repeat protein [Fodinibius sp.]NIX16666.1 tetratricopeptide repeat protein [Candidatus Dadabacteria bacterium]NIX61584.1 tetratricopeptide repeat protein [Nitrosopumilaceae archaeon]